MVLSKIALVTGGSRGIGKSIALSLAKNGAHVLLTYHSNQPEAQATLAEIEALGQKAVALRLDTSDLSSFDVFLGQATAAMQAEFGTDRLDFLINNAGAGGYATVADTTEAQFDFLLNVHFKGVFFLTQKALPLLNDGGRIVNISTAVTRVSYVGYSVYGSAKSAVETFTRYLAQELGSRGITVNAVAPGAVATDFGGGAGNTPEMHAFAASITALGRIGQPDDIADVVAFLCSDAARWITAQRIEASGGQQL